MNRFPLIDPAILDHPLPEPRPVSDRSAIGLCILIAALGFIGVASTERAAEREEAKVEAMAREANHDL